MGGSLPISYAAGQVGSPASTTWVCRFYRNTQNGGVPSCFPLKIKTRQGGPRQKTSHPFFFRLEKQRTGWKSVGSNPPVPGLRICEGHQLLGPQAIKMFRHDYVQLEPARKVVNPRAHFVPRRSCQGRIQPKAFDQNPDSYNPWALFLHILHGQEANSRGVDCLPAKPMKPTRSNLGSSCPISTELGVYSPLAMDTI